MIQVVRFIIVTETKEYCGYPEVPTSSWIVDFRANNVLSFSLQYDYSVLVIALFELS